MVAKVLSLGLSGIGGFEVLIECDLSTGLPDFTVAGLPGQAVKEARERVRTAMKNCGFPFPTRRIVVNLAPADVRKEGTLYDLPILLGLLAADSRIQPPPSDSAFVGELSLDGRLRRVDGILPMAICAKEKGVKKLFVPADNAAEAAVITELEVYGVSHLRNVLAHLGERKPLKRQVHTQVKQNHSQLLDFSEVRGQDMAKRALEIAAAGGHNVLLVGPPGSGKSMLARRLPSILPDMTRAEQLEATAIHSVCGYLSQKEPLLTARPFRSPHHTISAGGLAGGGVVPRPGEMSLAHMGVLFLDEMPEFNRDALESLRQPMEDGEVSISRVVGMFTYPARFMLCCAMNPCRCGWHGYDPSRCRCGEESVRKYYGRISGPLMDRIDLRVDVPSVTYEELSGRKPGESSAVIRERVNAARQIQNRRFGGRAVCNAHMTARDIEVYCELDDQGKRVIEGAFTRLGMTGRSYSRVLKVARTAADLEACEGIKASHLQEALQYRQAEKY